MSYPLTLLRASPRVIAKAGFIAIAAFAPMQLMAQQQTCSQATNTLLSTSTSRDSLVIAASTIVHCNDQAARVIASMLRNSVPGSLRDTLARIDARTLMDNRLSDSVAVLAKDPHQSIARRTYFLGLLARYYNPRVSVSTLELNSAVPVVLVPVYHPGVVVNARPITGSSRERVMAAIVYLSTHDGDADIRKLAGLIASQINSYPQ
ncbi:MAG TPA: hypothetical protein VF461_14870 [Gemmatimonadaceae bacterium]